LHREVECEGGLAAYVYFLHDWRGEVVAAEVDLHAFVLDAKVIRVAIAAQGEVATEANDAFVGDTRGYCYYWMVPIEARPEV